MVKPLIIALASCLSLGAQAADWDFLKSEANSQLYVKSYSGVLLGSQSHHSDNFDLWLINTGYQYPVEDDISLYMEAGPAVGRHSEQAGFNISSGVRYRLSPSLNIGSQLKQLEVSKASTLVELNSSLLVTPQLAITANYGLSAFSTEHFLTLGVGFNF
jgi:opacity protein-like surface antigen